MRTSADGGISWTSLSMESEVGVQRSHTLAVRHKCGACASPSWRCLQTRCTASRRSVCISTA
eukprot:8173516-Prorocentrum_lima.AAC.1